MAVPQWMARAYLPVRRLLSRTGWAVRLYALPRSKSRLDEPGLILVQIDGLSRGHFEQALARGNMPFLKKLRAKNGYKLYSHYSGLPSSTPGVQGEIFYGVRTAVPAFGFVENGGDDVETMFSSGMAARTEAKLKAQARGVLEGGSGYSNIYTGGAAEAHFCASSLGWDELRRSIHPVRKAIVRLLYVPTLLRVLGLAVVEFFLAVYDAVKGVGEGENFFEEMKFIPLRLGIAILLREFIVMGAQIDVHRGLPIVQVNFLGFDEQAHRRGPSSLFAQWTLKGIDRAIRYIWNVAKIAGHRRYALWIYSDHGQEDVLPYPEVFGRTIQEAVHELVKEYGYYCEGGEGIVDGIQRQRAAWLRREEPARAAAPPDPEQRRVLAAAVGPVGFLYFPGQPAREMLEKLAHDMVHTAGVPMAALRLDGRKLRIWTVSGDYVFPDEAREILGEHPFFDDVVEDLLRMAFHEHAGPLSFYGWRRTGGPIMSFPYEAGAHAGPGYNETHGFALLPGSAPVKLNNAGYMRPSLLRETILAFRKMHDHEADVVEAATRKELRAAAQEV